MRNELTILREYMRANGLDAYLIFSSDPHGSEYVHPHFKFREWVSGFSGSNGTLLVTLNDAVLWTDSRYYIQAEIELGLKSNSLPAQTGSSGIRLFKYGMPGIPNVIEYVLENASAGRKIGVDAGTIPAALGKKMERAFAAKQIELINIDLSEMTWNERPALTSSPISLIIPKLQGNSFDEKIEKIREDMSDEVDMLIVSNLDEIAWLLNLRGSDIPHNPVFYSYLVIKKKAVKLYIFEEAANIDVRWYFGEHHISVRHYNNFFKDISNDALGTTIEVDESATSYSLYNWLKQFGNVVSVSNPVARHKAIKSIGEIGALLNANIRDGRAMVRFIYWLKKTVGKEELTELSVSDTLDYLRKYEGAIDTSFETIAAYGKNAAIVHYNANENSNATLSPEGFLLVDSGGHYLDSEDLYGGAAGGTTDITRTIALGPISDDMKLHYTAVLQGMIDLATAIFPAGIEASILDGLAHKYLWTHGLDYGHETGHGIGFALSVHEPYVSISKKSTTVFEPGMVVSDEPGVYIENEYGIRIENDLLCVEADLRKRQAEIFKITAVPTTAHPARSLAFETLTLCPFEKDAIVVDQLTTEQRRYINNYHKKVYDLLAPGLEPEVAKWLAEETMPI